MRPGTLDPEKYRKNSITAANTHKLHNDIDALIRKSVNSCHQGAVLFAAADVLFEEGADEEEIREFYECLQIQIERLRRESEEEAEDPDETYRCTLRIPLHLLKKIDQRRRGRAGRISRNQMIIDLVDYALDD